MEDYKVVGIRFQIKKRDSVEYSRTYYYKTKKEYCVGQIINIQANNGGAPDAMVVEVDVKRNGNNLVWLKEVN